MNPQEIEKLLGGYATDTLTEEERRTLFEAALGNQALFDALADEQALRELLEDPPSRAHLLAALREERVSPLARFLAWMRRPSAIALAAAVAAGVVTIAVVIPHRSAEKPAVVALHIEPKKQVQLEAPEEKAPEPKPATPAPAGSPRRAAVEKAVEPERDAIADQKERAPAASNVPAPAPAKPAEPVTVTAAAPPPPPAIAMAPPAQSQFRATETMQQQAQPKLADAAPPAPTGAALSAPAEVRKKEAAQPSARALYYSAQANAVSGFVDQPKSGVAGGSFGRTATLAKKRAAAPPAAVIGGVRYSILKRSPDGSFVEVDPSTIFAPGDALRLRFETNQAGNLAVMERKTDGAWTLRLAARTQPGQAVVMPSESTIDVTATGAFRFFVRFSRSLRSEARLDQVAPTPSLLRETAANSVYVVNPLAAPDPMVDFELAINAR
jgi:hypothetical protein